MPKKTRLHRIIDITLKNGDALKPELDEEMRILAGTVTHVTGTDTILYIEFREGSLIAIFMIDNAIANSGYTVRPVRPVTATGFTEEFTALIDFWFDSKHPISFVGAAGAHAALLLEVVKIDPLTGVHLG